MKFRADFLHGEDANFTRQQRICAPQDRGCVHCSNCFDICDLAVRMNTRVGTARTRNGDLLIEEPLKGLLELALNRAQLRLNLPTVKVRSVISKRQFEVSHSIGYSMCLGLGAMPAISATIITFNEVDRIAEAIGSLSCCDEIIVVDSGSTDQTREIALARGARIVQRRWEGYAKQKNFAAEQARNDWILSMDADERLSIELADEIVYWKKSAGEGSGFEKACDPHPAPHGAALSQGERAVSMPRRVFYLGRWIKHSGWYPDRKIRLYDRRVCRWEGDFVHEWLKVDGAVSAFKGDLLHFPYRHWKDHVARISRYSELAARAARSSGRRGNIGRLLMVPPLVFLKAFLLRGGFLDGWRGLAIAYMGARYAFQKEFRILR